jgi:hypothetical protein
MHAVGTPLTPGGPVTSPTSPKHTSRSARAQRRAQRVIPASDAVGRSMEKEGEGEEAAAHETVGVGGGGEVCSGGFQVADLLDDNCEEEALVCFQRRKRWQHRTLLVQGVGDEGCHCAGSRERVVPSEVKLRPIALAEVPSCRCAAMPCGSGQDLRNRQIELDNRT